jgi:hypothetical protein
VLAVKTFAPVADKLGEFTRLLTSKRDGEMVAGRRAAEEAQPATFHNVDDDGPPWHAIACECAALLDQMRDQQEKDFVADMVRWITCGSEPTEKQAKWLRSIYVRVRR